VATGDFVVRPITEADARAVAAWHYRGVYAFYDWDQDADDLAEPLDPAEWGRRYFAADDREHELVGLFVFELSDRSADIGLGLRPDLIGRGLEARFFSPDCASRRRRSAPRTTRSRLPRSTAERSPSTSEPASAKWSATSTPRTAASTRSCA